MKTIIAVLCLAVSMCSAVDYCSNTLLQCDAVPHVACNNSAHSGWGSGCQNSNPKEVPMTDDIIVKMLDTHNAFRHNVSSGFQYLPGATRMATLLWNNELEKLALKNARNCPFGFDNCRNNVEFIGAGQNISIPLHKSNAVIAEIINETIFNITRDWFKAEHANGYADLLKRERNYPILILLKPLFGLFTKVETGAAYGMGCGATQWDAKATADVLHTNIYVVCAFPLGNFIGSEVYGIGGIASDCTTGTNPKYPALCSVDENYRGTYWYPTAGAH